MTNYKTGSFLNVSPKTHLYNKVLAIISATILKERINRQMSQKQFAKFMGVSQSMISKWESADYNFSIESIAQIADKLGLDFDIELKKGVEYLRDESSNGYIRNLHNKHMLNDNKLSIVAA